MDMHLCGPINPNGPLGYKCIDKSNSSYLLNTVEFILGSVPEHHCNLGFILLIFEDKNDIMYFCDVEK